MSLESNKIMAELYQWFYDTHLKIALLPEHLDCKTVVFLALVRRHETRGL